MLIVIIGFFLAKRGLLGAQRKERGGGSPGPWRLWASRSTKSRRLKARVGLTLAKLALALALVQNKKT